MNKILLEMDYKDFKKMVYWYEYSIAGNKIINEDNKEVGKVKVIE